MKQLLYNIDLYPDEINHFPNCAILVDNGKVEKIIENYVEYIDKYDSVDLKGMKCLPGYIDVHTHGGFGYDFLKQPEEAKRVYSENCVKEGCTSYLASFVAEDHDYLLKSLGYYANYKNERGAECLGVHLEGPFLNTKYQAVMREGALRNPSLKEFMELLEKGNGHIIDMTIAPELPQAYEVIDYAIAHNVNIMLGHSNATIDEARKAIEHRAIGLTHLYNAMSPHTHRDPGLVTAGLLLDDLICELITDGFHVNKDVIRVTYNAIGSKRIALVTDASLIKGLEDGTYEFSSQTVNKKGICATVETTGRIAGSVVGMNDCVKNMIEFTGCSFNEVVQMASINPSKIARVSEHKGKLLMGYDADMVLLDDELNVLKTFVGGLLVYDKEATS